MSQTSTSAARAGGRTAVFLNGQFLDDPALARVSAFDAGFQHGVGLFETMIGGVRHAPLAAADEDLGEFASEQPSDAGQETWVHRLDEHLDRLAASARVLGLSDQLNTIALAEAVLATIERSNLRRARVRLTISAGDLNLLANASAQAALGQAGKGAPVNPPHTPTILIVAQPATTYPAEMYERGVRIALADTRANPLNPMEGHKTLNYWQRLRDLQSAAAKGCAEALVLNVTNHLAGGCVSNVFLVKDSTLLTPIAQGEEDRVSNTPTSAAWADPLAPGEDRRWGIRRGVIPSPVLPGVVRQWVIDRAELVGLKVERRMVTVAELLDADEVFLTNSSWGVLPVVELEGSRIGRGSQGKSSRRQPGEAAEDVQGLGGVGEVCRRLIRDWRVETYAG